VLCSPLLHTSLFFSLVHTNIGNDNHVIIIISNMCFELVDTGQKGLKESTIVSRIYSTVKFMKTILFFRNLTGKLSWLLLLENARMLFARQMRWIMCLGLLWHKI
jgi:hypothetical protein